ncbi:ketopantoate reductase family protein [Alteromonas sp. CYL-A6]|uniref:ketopantoate reductase family protein n=1 Tax=Alteromonas nitratireducens TaxID=3390813 RepID=UPI0034ACCF30
MTPHETGFKRLLIAGSGAIGCLLAAGAVREQFSYTLFPRHLPHAPISVTDDSVMVTLDHFDALPVRTRPDDLLVVPVKVYQVSEVVRHWAPHLHPQTPVLLMHNGMGGTESARFWLPAGQPLFSATTTHGAYRADATHVRHTGHGQTTVGTLDSPPAEDATGQRITALLARLLGSAEFDSDMKTAMWKKLAVNAVINPLTALHDMKNGEVLDEQWQPLVRALCVETVNIAQAEGVMLTVSALVALVNEVATRTADNYSSMHQDVLHRRRTEIDGINGYLATLAKKRGIDALHHASLTEQIRQLATT